MNMIALKKPLLVSNLINSDFDAPLPKAFFQNNKQSVTDSTRDSAKSITTESFNNKPGNQRELQQAAY